MYTTTRWRWNTFLKIISNYLGASTAYRTNQNHITLNIKTTVEDLRARRLKKYVLSPQRLNNDWPKPDHRTNSPGTIYDLLWFLISMFTNIPLENENNRDQKALQPSSMMYLGLLSLNNSNTREWASCRILFSILLEHDEIYQHNRPPPPPHPTSFFFLLPLSFVASFALALSRVSSVISLIPSVLFCFSPCVFPSCSLWFWLSMLLSRLFISGSL